MVPKNLLLYFFIVMLFIISVIGYLGITRDTFP
jgi:hypothetical protein